MIASELLILGTFNIIRIIYAVKISNISLGISVHTIRVSLVTPILTHSP